MHEVGCQFLEGSPSGGSAVSSCALVLRISSTAWTNKGDTPARVIDSYVTFFARTVVGYKTIRITHQSTQTTAAVNQRNCSPCPISWKKARMQKNKTKSAARHPKKHSLRQSQWCRC